MEAEPQTIIQAIMAACGAGGGAIIYKINSKAQKALDRTEAIDDRLERIETNLDALTAHLLNK